MSIVISREPLKIIYRKANEKGIKMLHNFNEENKKIIN